ELGYVGHEPSVAERAAENDPPHVEFIVGAVTDEETTQRSRRNSFAAHERDAEQVAARIKVLVSGTDFNLGNATSDTDSSLCHIQPRDIAILLRAFTGVWTYENALRRAGIPYLTVQGKGFYQREEITDLIQLLRF